MELAALVAAAHAESGLAALAAAASVVSERVALVAVATVELGLAALVGAASVVSELDVLAAAASVELERVVLAERPRFLNLCSYDIDKT